MTEKTLAELGVEPLGRLYCCKLALGLIFVLGFGSELNWIDFLANECLADNGVCVLFVINVRLSAVLGVLLLSWLLENLNGLDVCLADDVP